MQCGSWTSWRSTFWMYLIFPHVIKWEAGQTVHESSFVIISYLSHFVPWFAALRHTFWDPSLHPSRDHRQYAQLRPLMVSSSHSHHLRESQCQWLGIDPGYDLVDMSKPQLKVGPQSYAKPNKMSNSCLPVQNWDRMRWNKVGPSWNKASGFGSN